MLYYQPCLEKKSDDQILQSRLDHRSQRDWELICGWHCMYTNTLLSNGTLCFKYTGIHIFIQWKFQFKKIYFLGVVLLKSLSIAD